MKQAIVLLLGLTLDTSKAVSLSTMQGQHDSWDEALYSNIVTNDYTSDSPDGYDSLVDEVVEETAKKSGVKTVNYMKDQKA